MGRSGNPGQGGCRGFGRGGRGKGGWNKKKNSNLDKKETNKKFLFTLLQSTVNVRVSAYETTQKKMFQQLMKDIKTHPEDVIDSLKDKKKKNVLNRTTLKTKTGTTTDEGKLKERLENEAFKLEYVN